MKKYFAILLCCFSCTLNAAHRVVNVYGWSGELPRDLIHAFERDTGIHVNFSTYDNNEILYAKLHATKFPIYDLIMPSAYFVERLKKQSYLEKLDKTRLPHMNNIDKQFNGVPYDSGNQYSIPLIWGVTGIFYNSKWINEKPKTWSDLWKQVYKDKLMLIDDPREVFGMSLITLGYNPNEDDAFHISQAFEHLKNLAPNIKLFASENIKAIIIDEDVHIGQAFNGDAFKAHLENPDIKFIYPTDGFGMWIDCLSLLKNAPHRDEAYEFLDYMLRAKSAETIARREGHALTNKAGRALLPDNIRNNPMIYPTKEVLERGVVQSDIPDNILRVYNYYWQRLKFTL